MRPNTIFQINRHVTDKDGADKYVITVDDDSVTHDEVLRHISKSSLKNQKLISLQKATNGFWVAYYELKEDR